jgi:hypothetical protein
MKRSPVQLKHLRPTLIATRYKTHWSIEATYVDKEYLVELATYLLNKAGDLEVLQ